MQETVKKVLTGDFNRKKAQIGRASCRERVSNEV